jgi:hypothetical protein
MVDLKRILLDLKRTLDCLNVIKQEGGHKDREYRIGVIAKEAAGEVGSYGAGTIVLFYTSTYNPSLIVESAMNKEEIEQQKKDNSGLRTTGTMVGVPKSYVRDLTDLFPIGI